MVLLHINSLFTASNFVRLTTIILPKELKKTPLQMQHHLG